MSIPADVFGVVSSVEKTPELSDFWFSRYQQYLHPATFQLRPKTLEVLQAETHPTPFTPTGEIIVSGCLKEDGKIDTSKLQDIVYASVRFLDACIDAMRFEDGARMSVEEFRKIGIGITGLEVYLQDNDQGRRQERIDILGEQFAKLVYRASETIAQEKGVYGNFDSQKSNIQPFAFERYEHKDTGAIKDGAALVLEGAALGWFKLPRRNSVLLALPTTTEWQKWSDRVIENTDEVALPEKEQKSQSVLPQPRFELGELVKITQKHSPHFGRVGQVVDVVRGEVTRYKLATVDQQVDGEEIAEDDISIIQTEEVIQKLDRFVSIDVLLVIVSETFDRVILIDGKLPIFALTAYQSLEQQVTAYLSQKTGSFIDIVQLRIIQTQFAWEKRVWSMVVSLQIQKIPKNMTWVTYDSPTLTESERSAITETMKAQELQAKLVQKIEKLEAQIEEQKTLLQIQKRESLELLWMKEFGVLQGGKQVALGSGYTMELSLKVENGIPKELQLKPVGTVPTSLITIMKLIEVAVSGRVHDSVQLSQALMGLAKIARSTNDSASLDIIEAVQKTLGLTVDQRDSL